MDGSMPLILLWLTDAQELGTIKRDKWTKAMQDSQCVVHILSLSHFPTFTQDFVVGYPSNFLERYGGLASHDQTSDPTSPSRLDQGQQETPWASTLRPNTVLFLCARQKHHFRQVVLGPISHCQDWAVAEYRHRGLLSHPLFAVLCFYSILRLQKRFGLCCSCLHTPLSRTLWNILRFVAMR
jgi:hypothetical protein